MKTLLCQVSSPSPRAPLTVLAPIPLRRLGRDAQQVGHLGRRGRFDAVEDLIEQVDSEAGLSVPRTDPLLQAIACRSDGLLYADAILHDGVGSNATL